MTRLGHLLSRFRRSTGGAAALEFALVGSMVLLIPLETLQDGLYFYDSASLDRATAKAVRQIMTGAVPNQNLTADQFRTTILCPLLPATISCASVITNVVAVSEGVGPSGGFYAFINAAQTGIVQPTMDNSKTAFCPGSSGSYVYVQVYYAMPTVSPIWRALSTTWNGSPVHFIRTSAAFKNEPFQSSATGC